MDLKTSYNKNAEPNWDEMSIKQKEKYLEKQIEEKNKQIQNEEEEQKRKIRNRIFIGIAVFVAILLIIVITCYAAPSFVEGFNKGKELWGN